LRDLLAGGAVFKFVKEDRRSERPPFEFFCCCCCLASVFSKFDKRSSKLDCSLFVLLILCLAFMIVSATSSAVLAMSSALRLASRANKLEGQTHEDSPGTPSRRLNFP
jgi:hypothetical protein